MTWCSAASPASVFRSDFDDPTIDVDKLHVDRRRQIRWHPDAHVWLGRQHGVVKLLGALLRASNMRRSFTLRIALTSARRIALTSARRIALTSATRMILLRRLRRRGQRLPGGDGCLRIPDA